MRHVILYNARLMYIEFVRGRAKLRLVRTQLAIAILFVNIQGTHTYILPCLLMSIGGIRVPKTGHGRLRNIKNAAPGAGQVKYKNGVASFTNMIICNEIYYVNLCV